MAKSKGFFGLRTGSTKSLTFSVLDGKQITKDRVVGGKNPRSNAQMQQRMCMATASAAYAAMKQIVDHSFEGYSYGANNMSRFISLNTKLIKECLLAGTTQFGYNPYGDRQLKQGGYIVSQGTASSLNYSINTALVSVSGGNARLSLSFDAPAEGATLSADYIMSFLGVKAGEMATYVAIVPDSYSDGNNFVFVRFKFLKGGTAAITASNFSDYVKIESNYPITPALNVEGHSFDIAITGLAVDTSFEPNFGWIHSVKTNNGWLRSNVTLTWKERDEYPETAENALATYPVGETYILNGGAING